MSSNSQPINNNLKLDAQLIIDVEKVLSKLGLTQEQALIMYYQAIAKTGQIPLDLSVPNAETLQAIYELDNNINVHHANSVEELFADLDSED